MSFWNVVWLIVISFAFVAYLMILFMILGDLFRDRKLSAWFKALWIVGLIVFPYLTALVYIVARGRGMAGRRPAAATTLPRPSPLRRGAAGPRGRGGARVAVGRA